MSMVGYALVSTKGQDLSLQINELKKYGCNKVSMEKESGSKSDRPELKKHWNICVKGIG